MRQLVAISIVLFFSNTAYIPNSGSYHPSPNGTPYYFATVREQDSNVIADEREFYRRGERSAWELAIPVRHGIKTPQ